MSTTFYPNDSASSTAISTDETKQLLLTRGGTAVSAVTNTVAGPVTPPTTATQVTKTAAGNRLAWLSNPLDAVSLTGNVLWNVRALESAAQANAAVSVEVYRCSGAGAILSTILAYAGAITELGTTESARSNSSVITPTNLSAGDRLGFRIYIDDALGVTMGSGRTVTCFYNGPTLGASGDTYIELTETITEQSVGADPYPLPHGSFQSPLIRM